MVEAGHIVRAQFPHEPKRAVDLSLIHIFIAVVVVILAIVSLYLHFSGVSPIV